MATAADLINAFLRKLRVIDIDSTADATQLANGLAALNMVVDAWNAEKISLFQEGELTALTLTGATSYTIGSGGDLNVTRPDRILSAYYRLSSQDYPPLRIVNKVEWDRLPNKTEAGVPELLWYDMAYGSTARGVLHLWPNPSSGSLILTAATPITEFAATSTTVSLPPGYRAALIYAGAVAYSSEGGILTQEIIEGEKKYMGIVRRRNNQRTSEVVLEVASLTESRYGNILQGP